MKVAAAVPAISGPSRVLTSDCGLTPADTADHPGGAAALKNAAAIRLRNAPCWQTNTTRRSSGLVTTAVWRFADQVVEHSTDVTTAYSG